MKKTIATTLFGLSLLMTSCYDFNSIPKVESANVDLTGDGIPDVLITDGSIGSQHGNTPNNLLFVGNKDGTYTPAIKAYSEVLFYIGENGMDYVSSYKGVLRSFKMREIVCKNIDANIDDLYTTSGAKTGK